jgi:translation initiation factor IF-2
MAKIRVYELARDLNMTNKSLIEKMKDMDIDVEIKSHMSALEDEAVAQIKAGLFGQKSETVVETRVKPTVIRRRKKTVTVEVPPEIEAAEEAPPQSRPKRRQLRQKKPRHRRRSQNRRRVKRRRSLQKQRSKPKSKPKKKPKRPTKRKHPQRLRRLNRNQRQQNRPQK